MHNAKIWISNTKFLQKGEEVLYIYVLWASLTDISNEIRNLMF